MSRTEDILERLAAGAPARSPDVRALARFAANGECRLATLGFAARVNFDLLLDGTAFAAPFGQSPFAFRRGNRFENMLRKDGYAPIFSLLRDVMNYDVSGARPENVRDQHAKSRKGFEQGAEITATLIKLIVAGSSKAPNLIDGAVLTRDIAGRTAFFEADAVAAQFGQPIHAGEVKSFPSVDGQPDPEKVGAAMSQAAIYILLLRDLVERVGGSRELVSGEALLITPLNTGMRPTLAAKRLDREIDRADRILREAPSARELVEDLPNDVPTFASVARASSEAERLDAAHKLVEVVGTTYRPSCLSSCGFSRLCREKAHACGDPGRVGGPLLRLLPGIATVDRASELASGALPSAEERPASEQLVRAAKLLRKVAVGGRR